MYENHEVVRARRVIAALLAALLAASGLVGVAAKPTGAAPPKRLTGLEVVVQGTSMSSASPRGAKAECPGTKRVLGGGVFIPGFDDVQQRVQPTMLRPYQDGTEYGFRIRVTELGSGTVDQWQAFAYAVCADASSLTNHQIVETSTGWVDRGSRTTETRCPRAQQRALGVGAGIYFPSDMPLAQQNRLGLQVMRTTENGDLVRTQARELPNRPNHLWQLVGYAVCADIPAGYDVVYGESAQRDSEDFKTASARCPGDTYVTGAGAAVTDVAPGEITLHDVSPPYSTEYRDAWASAVENIRTIRDWDFMVAQAICADAVPET